MSVHELVPVREHEGRQVVSGRDLHEFLQLGRDYTNWFKQMVEYGFQEGQDFTPILAKSTGGRPSMDHALSIDMGKELGMIQRTELGRQIRQYFIEVEKRSTTPQFQVPQSYAAALELAALQAREIESLEAQRVVDAPKILLADSIATSSTTILIGELAKILKGNGLDIGANRLFERLREDGYLIRRRGTDWNMPTQRSMDLGLFKITERTINRTDGVSISKTPKVTGKGQQYFVNRYTEAVV